MLSRWNISGWVAIGVVLMMGRWGWACGGGYGNYEAMGSDGQLLRTPDAEFLAELERILPGVKKEIAGRAWGAKSPAKTTAEADVADLQAAMAEAGWDRTRSEAVMNEYQAAREEIRKYRDTVTCSDNLWWVSDEKREEARRAVFVPPRVPGGLPREFELYLKGAIAWHGTDITEARRQWLAVMALPAAQRKYRSVWAAYMLGRSYVGVDDKLVIDWMKMTRKLAEAGFADSMKLAIVSYGWQAMATYKTDRLAGLELYVAQAGAEAKTETGVGTAAASLRMCAAEMIAGGEQVMQWAAKNELPRGLITAHLVAGPSSLWSASWKTGPTQVEQWLAAIEHAHVHEVAGAGRLAWAAYRTNLMELAQRWADRAPANDMMGCWIKAKLLLRAGKSDAAAEQLAIAFQSDMPTRGSAVTAQLRQAQRLNNHVAEDLAAMRLSRKQYVDAMDLLATHDCTMTACYIAERVLNTDELLAYVKTHPSSEMSDVLARRLVREGRWKEAEPYFEIRKAKLLDEYVAAIRRGNDTSLTNAERADAFWSAANIGKTYGNELMGYSTIWSWRDSAGVFVKWSRFNRTTRADAYTLAPTSADEIQRVQKHEPPGDTGWNYMYEAASHAWRACQLMPDENEQTALRLCQAGSWMKYGDPEAADRFYKALVNRCGSTPLGKQADALRWFPQIPPAAPQ